MSDREQSELMKTMSLRPYTERTIVDRKELRAEMDLIRANRFATDRGEYSEFWRSVAVPVWNTAGEVIAAVTCGGRPERMTVEHQDWMRQEMMVLAEELSSQVS
jgi:DNA-binding IclR family transcriptional regulator